MKQLYRFLAIAVLASFAATASAQTAYEYGFNFGFGEAALPGETAPPTPASVVFGISSATNLAVASETGRLFSEATWTLSDVGVVRTIVAGDTADFASLAARLGNGLNDIIVFTYGKAKNSFAINSAMESAIFGGTIPSQIDLQGLTLTSVALRLDELNARFTPSTMPLGQGYLITGHATLLFTAVPEPSAYALMALGACGICFVARRRGSKLSPI